MAATRSLCCAALALTLVTTTVRAQDDQTAPLPDAAAAQINPATLPDTPIPPDTVRPEAAPAGHGRQRPTEPAMSLARAVSGVAGCLVCSPLGGMGGMLVGMSSYAIWLAAQGHASQFDAGGIGALPYFAFAGSGIGGALAGPLGALAMSAAVDLAQPKLWPIVIAVAAGAVGALAPIGGGIAMYEVAVNLNTDTDAQQKRAFQLTVLAPVVATAGIVTGALFGLLAYDVSYPLLGD